MTQFGNKLQAFKSTRNDDEEPDPTLTIERLRANQGGGVETNFVADNNLMIEVDRACESERPATDSTLDDLKLLEWVNFLRECDHQRLRYTLAPFFAYAEMPAKLAQSRAVRLHHFAKKFGLVWHEEESEANEFDIGRVDLTFDGLDEGQQAIMSVSFSALLLMLLINHYGEEFSPLGKFRRYLREYKRLIGIVSLREIAIARYVFATQVDCPGSLDKTRSRIEHNFARKNDKRPKNVADMCATALNGAFDLLLFNAMNIADTKGLDGRKLDCWLITFDAKLKDYNDLCFNASLGTGQAGLFTVLTTHADASEYWRQTSELLHKFALEGSKRVINALLQRVFRSADDGEIRRKIEELPRKARAVIALADAGL